jgi:hypothetical protein
MAATTRLSLYNGALRHCGERLLASLTENREPRRMLDAAWDDNFVKGVLEDGQWGFACRSGMYDYSPSVEPTFGYRRAFNKPTDFVRTMAVCQDEYFKVPCTEYSDERGFWYADLDTLYIKYVSSDPSFGADMSLWPQSFVDYVEVKLATKIVVPLKQNSSALEKLLGLADMFLTKANSQNAMADPAKFPPQGSWVRARTTGGRWNNPNRGS